MFRPIYIIYCVLSLCCAALPSGKLMAQEAGLDFSKTLRVAYAFSGKAGAADIALAELVQTEGWYGRRGNLDKLPLNGNGRLTLADKATGRVLYRTSFSTLFQEWLGTEEATRVSRSFENVFLVPMPQRTATLTVELDALQGKPLASFAHDIDPQDILIKKTKHPAPPHRYLLKSGQPEEKIDVAIVAEGYTAAESEQFYAAAQTAVDAILAHEPFGKLKDRFNFVAVALPSAESGVSVPKEGAWKQTALGSHFSTFYSDRYLTTPNVRLMHESLAGIPYEHIVVLANTKTYGGGGIYNSYTLTTAGHVAFRPVVVHEFGHSFAGLADEYYYDDQYEEFYTPEVEPWEQNITTLKDFSQKWQDLLPAGTPVPTDPKGRTVGDIGVYEGGGYMSTGVYRAFTDCRMKTNEARAFCPVCRRAIERLIKFYTE